MKKLFIITVIILTILTIIGLIFTAFTSSPLRNTVILIDPGHGGNDPGKVSKTGIKEKDLNLEIALMLRDTLAEKGFTVYLTRETDESPSKAFGLSENKQNDLISRIKCAEEKDADLLISIHENSYTDPSVCGAQVFYYSTSVDGSLLAAAVQSSLKENLAPDNNRVEKAGDSYYILSKSPCPAIIVECGFLSNSTETINLSSPEYQKKLVNAITAGLLQYLQQPPSSSDAPAS